MKTLYFTGTGNSLAVAKKIGGELISIAQVQDDKLTYKDDVIGLIMPTYGNMVPPVVKKFMENNKLEAEYTFLIVTYGMGKGDIIKQAEEIAQMQRYHFDYENSVLMLDNCQPQFDIAKEIEKLPSKKVDEQIQKIVSDIKERKHQLIPSTFTDKAGTFICKVLGMGKESYAQKYTKNYSVDDNCIKCGTCAKVCPMGNITVSDAVSFSDHCTTCQACIHNCPQHAIHFKKERNTERWRNPEVSLSEIIEANIHIKK